MMYYQDVIKPEDLASLTTTELGSAMAILSNVSRHNDVYGKGTCEGEGLSEALNVLGKESFDRIFKASVRNNFIENKSWQVYLNVMTSLAVGGAELTAEQVKAMKRIHEVVYITGLKNKLGISYKYPIHIILEFYQKFRKGMKKCTAELQKVRKQISRDQEKASDKFKNHQSLLFPNQDTSNSSASPFKKGGTATEAKNKTLKIKKLSCKDFLEGNFDENETYQMSGKDLLTVYELRTEASSRTSSETLSDEEDEDEEDEDEDEDECSEKVNSMTPVKRTPKQANVMMVTPVLSVQSTKRKLEFIESDKDKAAAATSTTTTTSSGRVSKRNSRYD